MGRGMEGNGGKDYICCRASMAILRGLGSCVWKEEGFENGGGIWSCGFVLSSYAWAARRSSYPFMILHQSSHRDIENKSNLPFVIGFSAGLVNLHLRSV